MMLRFLDSVKIDMINPDNPEFIPDPGEAQRPGPDTSGDPEDPTVVDPDNVPKDADVVARRRREADFLNSSTHATGEIPVESTGEIHNDFNEVDNAEPGSKSDESTDFDEDAGDSEDEDAEKISDILDGNVGDVNSRIDELADEAEYELIEAVRDAEVSGRDRSGIKDNIDYLLSEKNNNPKVILAGDVDEVNEYLDDLDLSDEDQKEQFDRVVDAEKGSDEPRVGIIDHADQLESAADESGD